MAEPIQRELLPRFRRAFFQALEARGISMRSAARQLGVHEQTVLTWSRRGIGPSPAMQARVLNAFPEVSELMHLAQTLEILEVAVRRREINGESLRLVRGAAIVAAREVGALRLPTEYLSRFWRGMPIPAERDPADHARDLRATLDLGISPIARIEEILEQLGIPCVRAAGVVGSGATKVVVSLLDHSGARIELPVIVFWGEATLPDHHYFLAAEAGYLRTPRQFEGRSRVAAVEAFADELLAPLAGLNQCLPVSGEKRSRMGVASLAQAYLVPVSVIERQLARAELSVVGPVDGTPMPGFFRRIAHAQGARWTSSQ
ncbi:hypothetical protein Verru16b_01405 [Lacunisphaera limnophila]|uniref:Uncharacterized protein n=1 Tax=Lacunisphaera limnophila TaxID=1838286 RepID=A0A1D8ATX5_9BACT|nr:hypothetical protein Verru16b_01405 [Lacunisphaera limnophila]